MSIQYPFTDVTDSGSAANVPGDTNTGSVPQPTLGRSAPLPPSPTPPPHPPQDLGVWWISRGIVYGKLWYTEQRRESSSIDGTHTPYRKPLNTVIKAAYRTSQARQVAAFASMSARTVGS
eukprot:scaffold49748_cov66-Phaeocystis_antarctica.AAC.4